MEEYLYFMWLGRIKGIGKKKINMLLDYFGHPKEIYDASYEVLKQLKFLNEKQIINLYQCNDDKLLANWVEELEHKKIQFMHMEHPSFPSLLKKIYDCPLGIYIRGELPPDEMVKVSVVGSRRCSDYGVQAAYEISKGLAAAGVVIVSGMAAGIDSYAHKGALSAGGRTIAVFGCGPDICYPAGNRQLMQKIIDTKECCVISEYPPGAQPAPQNFPMRNRIISGLSTATLVVEATKKSGTLITVEQALEQGRDVYAVPGNINSGLSQGTNALIKQGALMVTGYGDILEELHIICNNDKNDQSVKAIELADDEKMIYDCIGKEPVTIDNILSKTNRDIQTVQYILAILELKGYISKIPGQRFLRT